MRPVRAGLMLLVAALVSVAAPERARAAADSVLVRVGGDITGRMGDYIEVPVTVDLSGAPGRQLGSFRSQLTWNPVLLTLVQIQPGNFATPQSNTGAGGAGTEQITAVQPSGAGGVVTVYVAKFYVLSDTAQSPVTVSFDEMSATATSVTPFEILLPLVKTVQGTFCRSLGLWGDVNGDRQSNSLDALVALSVVVGLPVDTLLMTPALGDVDGDGSVTSRDALIMLSYAVGLPVTGYRVLLRAAGACGTGAAASLAIVPDSIELLAGQAVPVIAQASDASGRPVPVDSLVWVSSNPTVAGFQAGAGVQGRSPGFAILTARLGPGVQGTLKVSVIARRSTWYVDVQRALNAPTQVGSQALPFQFIGDAVGLAQDGDTVRVASGTYEEIVSRQVSVALLGDSLNPPVLDPRGSPNWFSSQDAVVLGSAAAPLVMANLTVRAGSLYLVAHDATVRNVGVQGLGGTNGFAAIEVVNANLAPAPPARGGPMRAGPPVALGNVLIDGVTVTADSTSNGIVVDAADTAIIRNSIVSRTTPGVGGCLPSVGASSGIVVIQASVSVVQNNVVVNPQCQGIGVFDEPFNSVLSDVGRATISRNRVAGAPGIGIGVGTRLVALDHNAVRNTGAGQLCCFTSAGIEVTGNTVVQDSITSRGDTVIGVGAYYDYGLKLDTALVATVDSLVVDSIGIFDVGNGAGFHFAGLALTLTNSRVSNTFSNGIEAFGKMVYTSRHNTVRNAGLTGILLQPSNCDCSVAGPDSVRSSGDSVLGGGFNGIVISQARYVLLDTAVVDSGGGRAILLSTVGRAIVRDAVLRRALEGLHASFVDTLSILGGTYQANVNGIYTYSPVDSVAITGAVLDANTGAGVFLDLNSKARIDSLVATGNGQGVYISSAGARIQRSRFQANGIGVQMVSFSSTSFVTNSTISGNSTEGARNDTYLLAPGDTLFADSNYWGAPSGPSCDTVVACIGTGDSIKTRGVTFANWLAAAPPTPAPPARPAYASAAPRRSFARANAGLAAAPRPPERTAPALQIPPEAAAPRAMATRRAVRPFPAPWHRSTSRQGIRVGRKH